MSKKHFRRSEVPAYLLERYGYEISPKTLAVYASVGNGPRFRKIGRTPIYEAADLDDWVRQRSTPKVTSTAELAANAA